MAVVWALLIVGIVSPDIRFGVFAVSSTRRAAPTVGFISRRAICEDKSENDINNTKISRWAVRVPITAKKPNGLPI